MIPVMIVEDEFLVRIGLKTCIPWEEKGFQVVAEAEDGQSALENYEKYYPRVIMTDIRLPDNSGLDVMRRIREKDNEVKFIIISAYDDFKVAQEAIGIGVDGYFLKGSIVTSELVETLERIKKDNGWEKTEKPRAERQKESLLDVYRYGETIERMRTYLELEDESDQLYLLCVKTKSKALDKFSSMLQLQMLETHYKERGLKNKCYLHEGILWIFLETKEDGIARVIEETIQVIRRYINSDVQIGVSDNYFIKGDVKTTFFEAVLACNYVRGTKGIVFERYNERECNYHSFRGLLRKYEEMFQLKREVEVQECLNEIFQAFETSYSVKVFRRVIYKMIGVMIDFDENNIIEGTLLDELFEKIEVDKIHRLIKEKSEAIMDRRNDVSENTYISQTKEYIVSHIEEPVNVSCISKEIHISPNYLGKIFYSCTGEYLTEYINKVKIDKAKKLLLEKSYSINEVAEKVGISDQRYFSKLFKKYCGVTPKTYAKSKDI